MGTNAQDRRAELQQRLQESLGSAFVVERELGGGGMARVFVAEDSALERRVVVKVFAAEMAEGLSADRFRREVKLAARLQHPHIVPLLTAGALADGALYYTMPYVEGEGLAERLAREGALPIGECVRLLRDIASALAYAHRHHVVHRDIKPANVLVSDGVAVVADFGIAKAVEAAGTTSEHPLPGERGSGPVTATGMALGTPAYMAPEQAAGDVVDHRTDIYALGLLAYELLSGHAPFAGRSSMQLLAAHVVQAPEPLANHRRAIPPALESLVMRCLEKRPGDRPQSADEIRRALDATYDMAGTSSMHGVPGQRMRRYLPWAIAGVAIAIALAVGALALRRPAATPARAMVSSIEPPRDARFLLGASFALSADGTRLAFVAQGTGPQPTLWVQQLDSLDAAPMRGTDGASAPFWSPDGRSVGFFADGQLKVADAASGSVRALCAAPLGEGGSWNTDGVIVFAPDSRSPIHRVAAAGGGACTAATKAAHSAERPSFLPDGRHFLYNAGGDVHLGDLSTGENWLLRHYEGSGAAGDAAFVAPDLVLFYVEGAIFAQRLDLRARKLMGEPQSVADQVTAPSGSASYSVSQQGVMVMHMATPEWVRRQLIRIDRRGGVMDSAIVAPAGAQQFRHSHRGDRIAFAGDGLAVHDVARDVATKQSTGEPRRMTLPVWSPDDSLIAYTGGGRRLMLHRLDRDTSEMLFTSTDGTLRTSDWSPDGRFILFSVQQRGTRAWSFMTYSLADRAARPLFATTDIRDARLSPDGRWIAYVAQASGAAQIYLRRFDGAGPPLRVSTVGGLWPRWRADGRELFYAMADGTIMSVAVTFGDVPVLSAPRSLAVVPPYASRPVAPAFEVSPDGRRFTLLVRREERQGLTLVANWPARLRAR